MFLKRFSSVLFLSTLSFASPHLSNIPLKVGPDALHALDDKVVLPVKDGDINPFNFDNLLPAKTAMLQYASPPPGRDTATLTFDMKYPVVVLENSAYTSDTLCSTDRASISITFNDAVAFRIAQTWPGEGLVLVTNLESCNPSDQRGVFLAHSPVSFESTDSSSSSITYNIEPKSWKDVASTLKISYGERKQPPSASPVEDYLLEKPLAHQKRQDGSDVPDLPKRDCQVVKSKAYRCGARGNLPDGKGTRLDSKIDSFEKCRDQCLQQPSCKALSFDDGQCILSFKYLRNGWFTKDSANSRQWYNRKCFHCSITGELQPDAKLIYDSLVANIKTDEAGNILARLPNSDEPTEIPPPDFDPEDFSGEEEINDTLQGDGLSTIEEQTTEAVEALSDINDDDVGTDDGDVVIQEPFPDLDDEDNERVSTISTKKIPKLKAWLKALRTHERTSSTAHKHNITDRSLHALQKRYGLGDFADDVQGFIDKARDIACDDLVSGFIEPVDDACKIYEGYEAVKCLAEGCLNDLPTGPKKMRYDFKAENTFQGQTFEGLALYYTSIGDTLSCKDCSLRLEDISMRGNIIQNLDTGKVVLATVEVTQTAFWNLIFNLVTTRPFSGKWNKGMSTVKLGTITSPGVFSIAPQIIHSFGVEFDTDIPLSITAGGLVKQFDQTTTIDMLAQKYEQDTSWVPSVEMRPPAFKKPGRLTWTSHMRTSMEFDIQLLGTQVNNIWAMTSESNWGYDAQVLDKGVSDTVKRDGSISAPLANTFTADASSPNDKRQSQGLTSRVDDARARKGKRALTCKAGSMRMITSMSTTSDIKFDGPPSNLFNKQYSISPKCYPFVKTTCGVLGDAVANGGFEDGGSTNSIPSWNTILGGGYSDTFRYFLPFTNRGEGGGAAFFWQINWNTDNIGEDPIIIYQQLSGLCVGTKYLFKFSYQNSRVSTSNFFVEPSLIDDNYNTLTYDQIFFDKTSKTDSRGNGVDTWNQVTYEFKPATPNAFLGFRFMGQMKGVSVGYIDNVSVVPKGK